MKHNFGVAKLVYFDQRDLGDGPRSAREHRDNPLHNQEEGGPH